MEKTCGNCRCSEWEEPEDSDFGCETEGQCTNKKAIELMPNRMVGVGYDYDCPEWMPKLKTAEPALRGFDSIGSGFDHN
jgi:hypothetical protein